MKFLALLSAIVCMALPAFAQDDPPSRVARLSYFENKVSVQPAGVEDWTPAEVNLPITTGEGLWADRDGKAELRLTNGVMYIAPGTGISFLNLDDAITQIRLDMGGIVVHLRQLENGESFEIATPNTTVVLQKAGMYRVDVTGEGDETTVIVRSGDAMFLKEGQAIPVPVGQMARVSGRENPSHDMMSAAFADNFERWCEGRVQRAERAESLKYVHPETVGFEDLDDNGSWTQDAENGPVWRPREVSAGWAPYRDGRWVWVDPWGWTWIDNAPWGFAPFHYGRWLFIGGSWGWIPGPRVERPVYAPALVTWVGGAGLAGGVAWVPLGPREAFVPSYRVSPMYLRRVNYTTVNVTTVTYVNRAHMTVVSRESFVSARPVRQSMMRVYPNATKDARFGSMADIAPRRASVLGRMEIPRTVARPPDTFGKRTVMARTAPPPPRIPFSQQEQMLSGTQGRPLDRAERAQLQPTSVSHSNVRTFARIPERPAAPPPQQTMVDRGPQGDAKRGGPAMARTSQEQEKIDKQMRQQQEKERKQQGKAQKERLKREQKRQQEELKAQQRQMREQKAENQNRSKEPTQTDRRMSQPSDNRPPLRNYPQQEKSRNASDNQHQRQAVPQPMAVREQNVERPQSVQHQKPAAQAQSQVQHEQRSNHGNSTPHNKSDNKATEKEKK